MYRAIYHRRPLINGYARYEPSWFPHLIAGLKIGDPASLRPFAERTALDILVHTGLQDSARLASVVEAAGAGLIANTNEFQLFHLPRSPVSETPPYSRSAAITVVMHEGRGDVTSPMTDDDPWSTVEAGDLTVTLSRPCRVDEVRIGVTFGVAAITVTDSSSGGKVLWSGNVGEQRVRGALAEPGHPRMRLRFPSTLVGGLRLHPRVDPDKPDTTITGVAVFGPDCSR